MPDDQVEAHRLGCARALDAGWARLGAGGGALDAAEAAVLVLEDDPIFDAGTGSVLTSEGAAELDAAIVDGRTLRYGAVANLRHIRNPITLARRVFEGPATLLVAAGAEQFARGQGIALCANEELVVERERAIWRAARERAEQPVGGRGTVGAIALDSAGWLVAANSTGGTPLKLPGRVGDTPLPGCGLYADTAGACVCTGWGEHIARVALARRAVEYLEAGLTPQQAAERAIALLADRVAGQGGVIVLDAQGRVGTAFNTPRMAFDSRII